MNPLIILVGCEESQEVCKAFRTAGHIAFSCDFKPCSGGHPEWHLQMDVFKAIKGGKLITQSGKTINIKKWDIGIFFPDCTFLTNTANKWLKNQPELSSGKLVGKKRMEARKKAVQFVKDLYDCDIYRVAIENPVGCLGTEWKKPTQIIQPYYFGDPHTKTTCLWLKRLPKLNGFNLTSPGERHITKSGKSIPAWYNLPPSEDRSTIRSKTFPGLAKAMADQWGYFQ